MAVGAGVDVAVGEGIGVAVGGCAVGVSAGVGEGAGATVGVSSLEEVQATRSNRAAKQSDVFR